MATIKTIDDLFLDELRDLYNAEKQIVKALPKMAKACTSDDLRSAFENHLKETQGQVQRLEEIFDNLGEKGTGKNCVGIEGIIKEGNEIASDAEEGAVRDAGLIVAAQKIEHYEISAYGSARTHAQLLGHEGLVSLLEATMREEKEADRKLNDIAESEVNEEALETATGDTSARAGTSKRTTAPKTRASGGGSRTSR